ncbi:terminase small subunit protein [Pseudoxanthomonas sp. USHLN014]|uniref:terminase small subunit-like protein n=1 Tax=Pseudoxanthomonas sp. USHLN014 TaxID=3081297 RepID=UPI00301B74E1
MADAICERIADGESLRDICAGEDMPNKATVFRWLGKHQEFSDQYARAREEQAESFADEMVAIADEQVTMVRADKHGTKADDDDGNTEVIFDATAVARNRLRVDTRKWVASKLKPKKYGDKSTTELTGPNGGPVETITSIKLVPLE